jgi:hypothetical protein
VAIVMPFEVALTVRSAGCAVILLRLEGPMAPPPDDPAAEPVVVQSAAVQAHNAAPDAAIGRGTARMARRITTSDLGACSPTG